MEPHCRTTLTERRALQQSRLVAQLEQAAAAEAEQLAAAQVEHVRLETQMRVRLTDKQRSLQRLRAVAASSGVANVGDGDAEGKVKSARESGDEAPPPEPTASSAEVQAEQAAVDVDSEMPDGFVEEPGSSPPSALSSPSTSPAASADDSARPLNGADYIGEARGSASTPKSDGDGSDANAAPPSALRPVALSSGVCWAR